MARPTAQATVGRSESTAARQYSAVPVGNRRTTRCLDAAVAQLRAEGHGIKDEDVARLSPLKDRHINFLGRYLFNIKASGPGRGLRPLRDPGAVEDAENEDG